MQIKFILDDPERIALVPIAQGVTTKGNAVFFDSDKFTKDKANCYMSLAMADPSTKFRKKPANAKALELTGDIKAQLEQLLPDVDNLDEFSVFEISAANSRRDFEDDRLTKDFLESMAMFVKKNNGIPFLFDHQDDKILGTVFDAFVQPISGDSAFFELIERVYVPPQIMMPNQPDTTVALGIKQKILQKVSVRFNGPRRIIEGSDGDLVREFFTDDSIQEVIHPESSFVFFGGQRGAAIKAFKEVSETKKEMKKTENKEIKVADKVFNFSVSANSENDTITLTAPPEFAAWAEKQVSDSVTLKASNDKLTKQINAIRDPLVNTAMNLQDKLVEADKDAFVFPEAELKDMDLDRLRAYTKSIDKTKQPINTKEGKEVEPELESQL